MSDPPSADDLVRLLQAVRAGDDSDAPLDNSGIAGVLGLSLETVAEQLAVARERRLVWGIRSSGPLAPWYTDLEVTVQGRRFLAEAGRAST